MGAIAIGAVLYGLGRVLGRPVRERMVILFLLWGLALGAAGLPSLARLHDVLGGTVQGWVLGGLLVVLVGGYAALVRCLAARARAGAQAQPQAQALGQAERKTGTAAAAVVAPDPVAAPAGDPPRFSAAELDRYARHILLREIGGPGQQRLKAGRVLVIGAGGLGSPVLLYLAAAGVGRIGVVDGDVVESSNLQRQILHAEARIGMPKVRSAEIAMKALNPFVAVDCHEVLLDPANAEALIAGYDLVLDGTDNFDTRYLVNRVCARLGKPLIAAAITQWEGQISLYHPRAGGPCYECVFPERPLAGMVPTCAEAGVAAPLPGVIGAMMAMEAVKFLTGAGQGLQGRLVLHDALYGETRAITIKPRPGCAACGREQGGEGHV